MKSVESLILAVALAALLFTMCAPMDPEPCSRQHGASYDVCHAP